MKIYFFWNENIRLAEFALLLEVVFEAIEFISNYHWTFMKVEKFEESNLVKDFSDSLANWFEVVICLKKKNFRFSLPDIIDVKTNFRISTNFA